MADYNYDAVRVGPVTLGRVSERKPKTQADRKATWICWIITVILIAQVAPFVGVILVLATAISYMASQSAAQQQHTDERTQP